MRPRLRRRTSRLWMVRSTSNPPPPETPMATVTLKGTPIHTVGELPKVGSAAPAFSLVKSDLSTVTSKDLAGKRVVLNIFPSVDTGT
jgi:hypothetical protein